MPAAADTEIAEQDSLSSDHGNSAAAIVTQLKDSAIGQPRARRPVEGLEDDGTTWPCCEPCYGDPAKVIAL